MTRFCLNRTLHRSDVRLSGLLVSCTVLMMCCGCGDSGARAQADAEGGSESVTAAPERAPGAPDPLADLLRLAEAGDMDAAIEQFVVQAQENWIAGTSLEELQMSEADFASLDRAEKNRLQQKAIGRVGELKGFARAVIDRATEAKNRGDEATAERYVEAVRRFGRQLRDADTLTIFQQTGNALSNVSLSQ